MHMRALLQKINLTQLIGTWINADDDASIPTNVTRLCRALRSSPRPTSTEKDTMPAARREQVIYYHRGIGTNGDVDSKWIGGGTGDELSEHARECYGFLCNNWREGDDIALFGFSRGLSPFLSNSRNIFQDRN